MFGCASGNFKNAAACLETKYINYKKLDNAQTQAYQRGYVKALEQTINDVKNLPQNMLDAAILLKEDPKTFGILMVQALKELPAEYLDKVEKVGKAKWNAKTQAEFEAAGKAELELKLEIGGLALGGAGAVKLSPKILDALKKIKLKGDFDPNLKVQTNGPSAGGAGNGNKNTKIDTETEALDRIKNNNKGSDLSNKPSDSVINQQASKRVSQVTAPIDFDGHILNAEIKRNGNVVGGHSIASGNVRVLEVIGKPDKNGVYDAKIAVVNPQTGRFVPKTNNSGVSTMFPDSWTAERIKVEVDFAYKNRTIVQNKPNMWEGRTQSGVVVRGFLNPQTTAYPKSPNSN